MYRSVRESLFQGFRVPPGKRSAGWVAGLFCAGVLTGVPLPGWASECGDAGAQAIPQAAKAHHALAVNSEPRSLNLVERTVLGSLFPDEVLKKTRLYFDVPLLTAVGTGNFQMTPEGDAQTFGYRIYFRQAREQLPKAKEDWIALLARQLEHVEQFVERGENLARYGRDYFDGWCRGGFEHKNNPLWVAAEETARQARELAYRFFSKGGMKSLPRYYGLTCLENATNLTIEYLYRWGEGPWKRFTLRRGKTVGHFIRYQYPNQNTAPPLEIRFDQDPGDGPAWERTYRVQRWAVPVADCEVMREREVFQYVTGRRWVDLYRNY